MIDEKGRVVIACRVMEAELEAVRRGGNRVELITLDQALHRTPQKMPGLIQEQVDRVSSSCSEIVLGYGLCSNGIVGVKASGPGLIVPRCHDCIAMFLGSQEEYEERLARRPGTYYLTHGWLAEKKDPLGIIEEEYTARVGRDLAIWAMKEELKNYTHISLIDTGVSELDLLRGRALENAEFFGLQYEEIPGGLDYFRKLVYGPYVANEFFVLRSGDAVTQELFLEEIP